MPVQLPPQPPGINLPVHPEDPPTLNDIVAAKYYKALVNVAVASQMPDAPNADDAARADANSTEDAAPAWFQPAVAQALAPIQITLAQMWNFQLLDGSYTPFKIVPFSNGSMPTQPPHNLPPLNNVAAIRALTAAQTHAYCAGYDLGNIGQAQARRAAIGRAVGCTVAI